MFLILFSLSESDLSTFWQKYFPEGEGTKLSVVGTQGKVHILTF